MLYSFLRGLPPSDRFHDGGSRHVAAYMYIGGRDIRRRREVVACGYWKAEEKMKQR